MKRDNNDIFRLVAGPNGMLQRVVFEDPNPSATPQNEQVTVKFPAGTNGGSFTLTFDDGHPVAGRCLYVPSPHGTGRTVLDPGERRQSDGESRRALVRGIHQ